MKQVPDRRIVTSNQFSETALLRVVCCRPSIDNEFLRQCWIVEIIDSCDVVDAQCVFEVIQHWTKVSIDVATIHD